MRYGYLTPFQADVVHAWWTALQPEARTATPTVKEQPETEGSVRPFWYDRGHRARLRRAVSLTELETESACFELRERLGEMKTPWLEQQDDVWLFLLAGTVASIEEDTQEDRSLALALGRAAAVDGQPPMSELRFRRLLKEEEPEPFFRQLRRAMQLASGLINVARLADDLIGWSAERGATQQRADAMHYRWARDYFLGRKDQKLAAQNSAAANPANGGPLDPQETNA